MDSNQRLRIFTLFVLKSDILLGINRRTSVITSPLDLKEAFQYGQAFKLPKCKTTLQLSPIRILRYADDLIFYTSTKDISCGEAQLNSSIEILRRKRIAKSLRFPLTSSKTNTVPNISPTRSFFLQTLFIDAFLACHALYFLVKYQSHAYRLISKTVHMQIVEDNRRRTHLFPQVLLSL